MKKRKTTPRSPSARSPAPAGGRAGLLFESVAAALLTDTTVSRSKMFGAAGLKIGGKFFAVLVKGRLVVKLPQERVRSFVESGAGDYFDPGHGRLMKEWVSVRPGSARDWLRVAQEARAFVASDL